MPFGTLKRSFHGSSALRIAVLRLEDDGLQLLPAGCGVSRSMVAFLPSTFSVSLETATEKPSSSFVSVMYARLLTTTVALVALLPLGTEGRSRADEDHRLVSAPRERGRAAESAEECARNPHSLPFTTTYSPSAPLEMSPTTPTEYSRGRMTLARGSQRDGVGENCGHAYTGEGAGKEHECGDGSPHVWRPHCSPATQRGLRMLLNGGRWG